MPINKDRICVSLYLKRDNFERLRELVLLKEKTTSMSRWLSVRVMKMVDNELKKQELKK